MSVVKVAKFVVFGYVSLANPKIPKAGAPAGGGACRHLRGRGLEGPLPQPPGGGLSTGVGGLSFTVPAT